jgi:hypothetical protein
MVRIVSQFVWLVGIATLSSITLIGSATGVEPKTIKVPINRDLWISAYPTETEANNGSSPRVKLKGNQEFFLFDFDLEKLTSQFPAKQLQVLSATLHLHAESDETLGRVTVSTIVDPWHEGEGASYQVVEGASCFAWQAQGQQRWSGDCDDITGVVLGNGGSRWGFGDASPRDKDNWYRVPVEPAVVQARLASESHGFFVMDDVGSEYTRNGDSIDYRLLPNRFFTSREGNPRFAPYLTLQVIATDTANDHKEETTVQSDSTNPAVTDSVQAKEDSLPPLRNSETLLPLQTEPTLPSAIRLLDSFGSPLTPAALSAARGEAIGIRVIHPGHNAHQVKLNSSVPVEVTVYAMPLVAGQVDPLVPVTSLQANDSPASAPSAAEFNGLPLAEQTYIEIYVPKTAAAGSIPLDLQVGYHRIELTLAVRDFTLPDQLSFLAQMNCYGLPGHEIAYYRLAHQHRTTLNQLRYNWRGRVQEGAAPAIGKDGAWDWQAWDEKFGPLFDGTAFRDGRRSGVPVEAFYLPLNENWPMDHEQAFQGGYWIEHAYPESYWIQFRDAANQFAQHIDQQGWRDTMFEFYLNNKVYFKRDRNNRWDACSAAWIFDEPVNTQDFWALRRFGWEFWRGIEQANLRQDSSPIFTFRADISQPQWQRDLLDEVTNVEVVSGTLRKYPQRVIKRARSLQNFVYMYGSANPIGTDNTNPVLWCLETWALGADGVVPWQTIGTAESWQKPDTLSLFYPTPEGPVPSLRLKAFQAGQQLTEYLTIYSKLSGINRDAIGKQLLGEYHVSGELIQVNEQDAGRSEYQQANASSALEIRQRLAGWLDDKQAPSRESWYNPRPRQPKSDQVISRQALQLGR